MSFYGLEVNISKDSKYSPAMQESILNAAKPLFARIAKYAMRATCKDTIVREFASYKPPVQTLSVCYNKGELFVNLRDKNRGMMEFCSFEEFMSFIEPDVLADIMYKTELMSTVDKTKMPFYVIGPGVDTWNAKLDACKKKREKEQKIHQLQTMTDQRIEKEKNELKKSIDKKYRLKITTNEERPHVEKSAEELLDTYKQIYKIFQSQSLNKEQENVFLAACKSATEKAAQTVTPKTSEDKSNHREDSRSRNGSGFR